ncbi:MAG: uroporphyrinogen-III C-methyltransferase [Candidatus Omnitrophica bacterium]|nr:uroporphyrinogen-III C-methyltransferase [Candidatus Omnitrophota bacterium]MDE2222925.1 uroporphyrinogen-III C-methyltransferase [Candidatus Omnitrophota bacterium]
MTSSLLIKIASRSSPLALAQIEEIAGEMKACGKPIAFEIIKIETAGDKDKTTPLTQTPDNFFTDAIDRALLAGQTDIAVHSAKDLPQQLDEGLKIFALTKGFEDKDAWAGRVAWKDLPPNPRIGTSSVLRQQQILAMRPDAKIIQIRGTIHERLQMVKEAQVDGVVVAACALKRLKLEDQIKDIFPWEGMPLQGQLAVVGRCNDRRLEELFSRIDVRRRYGKVTLVGAGPGDPELMTLKGLKALKEADCVVYDYLLDMSLLKHAPQAEHIYAGKRKGGHSLPQAELSKLLKEKAFAGKNVVRLKGGDPFIFGRGAEELEYLRAYHIDVEVVPGISAAIGIPSSLGIPLTARGLSSSVAFLSGHESDEDQDHPKTIAVPEADTLVFFMGLTKLGIIVKSLRQAGWADDTPVMIIANGTKPQEEIVKGVLADIEVLIQTHEMKPPALIVVGKTVDFYRPARTKTFLHCGTHPEIYRHLGRIIHWPMIEIQAVSLNKPQQEDLRKAFDAADMVICTSWYAAQNFVDTFRSIDPKTDWSAKIFAAIGQKTRKALQDHGIEPALVSQEETAEGLFKAIKQEAALKGKRILFPRSNLPNPFLKEALEKEGALVTEVAIYRNVKPARRDLPSELIDGIIFTSPSTVKNFLIDYGTIPVSWQILAKGPVTLKTLQEEGYPYATSLS